VRWLGQGPPPPGGTPFHELEYGRRLRMALLRTVEVPIEVDPVKKAEAAVKGKTLKETRTTDEMSLIVDKVVATAREGNSWAIEHVEGKPKKLKKETRTVDEMTLIVEKVIEMAKSGNEWAIEHIAQRFDGKVREQVEVTTNTNLKVRYESYEEVRAALLEEGINIDRLPMLEDLRSVEEQEPEQEPS
jgi:hypothetical protein